MAEPSFPPAALIPSSLAMRWIVPSFIVIVVLSNPSYDFVISIVPPLMSSVVSAWIPSSPLAIVNDPPLMTILSFVWIESSEESILKLPSSSVKLTPAFNAFALVVSSLLEDEVWACPGIPQTPQLDDF